VLFRSLNTIERIIQLQPKPSEPHENAWAAG
jgi:hypothetical protein